MWQNVLKSYAEHTVKPENSIDVDKFRRKSNRLNYDRRLHLTVLDRETNESAKYEYDTTRGLWEANPTNDDWDSVKSEPLSSFILNIGIEFTNRELEEEKIDGLDYIQYRT